MPWISARVLRVPSAAGKPIAVGASGVLPRLQTARPKKQKEEADDILCGPESEDDDDDGRGDGCVVRKLGDDVSWPGKESWEWWLWIWTGVENDGVKCTRLGLPAAGRDESPS